MTLGVANLDCQKDLTGRHRSHALAKITYDKNGKNNSHLYCPAYHTTCVAQIIKLLEKKKSMSITPRYIIFCSFRKEKYFNQTFSNGIINY